MCTLFLYREDRCRDNGNYQTKQSFLHLSSETFAGRHQRINNVEMLDAFPCDVKEIALYYYHHHYWVNPDEKHNE
ncbi:hypothetical protein GHT06_017702 [Daphnia sinensis]|uniref:Uncharacterized protein n=1 Tax=Daphnia sinensis TaxID=1820382 RepID=A0AAD5KMM7_9CRUS|nr:hypothetical protein GHT06_017702 [Daphnia sinensis]